MSVSLTGKAIVWGCGNLEIGAIITSSTAMIQNYSFSREADKYDLRDSIGDVVGRAFSDHRKTIQITCVPASTSTTQAKLDLYAMLPIIGTKATITDADGASTPIEVNASGTPSADYTIEEASVSRTNTGPAEISMTLSQREHNNTTATVT